MTEKEIIDLFSSFKNHKILIVGDSMIDAYMWGDIKRMSPEAPVPVVEIDKHENRLGGAANVARNLKALGSTPILCSVIGKDNQGILFKELMGKEGLTFEGILTSEDRKTTIKTRVISENKHQLRVDEEDTHPINNENQLLSLIDKLLEDISVVILQDYNKGVLTPNIIEKVIQSANTKGILTIVDPKKKNFLSYKNCSIFKPNLKEIKGGLNIEFDSNNNVELENASKILREKLNVKGVLLTLSERGICIKTEDDFTHTPAFKRNIVDVSGAGDTVISVASILLASEINYKDLSIISALAGGLVCEEVGVVPINKENLLKEIKNIYK